MVLQLKFVVSSLPTDPDIVSAHALHPPTKLTVADDFRNVYKEHSAEQGTCEWSVWSQWVAEGQWGDSQVSEAFT